MKKYTYAVPCYNNLRSTYPKEYRIKKYVWYIILAYIFKSKKGKKDSCEIAIIYKD
jgi:hypothetical protein